MKKKKPQYDELEDYTPLQMKEDTAAEAIVSRVRDNATSIVISTSTSNAAKDALLQAVSPHIVSCWLKAWQDLDEELPRLDAKEKIGVIRMIDAMVKSQSTTTTKKTTSNSEINAPDAITQPTSAADPTATAPQPIDPLERIKMLASKLGGK